jgi:hypothetical protein
VSASCQHNGHAEPFPAPELLKAIATAMDLLEEAACHALLRDVCRIPEPVDADANRSDNIVGTPGDNLTVA